MAREFSIPRIILGTVLFLAPELVACAPKSHVRTVSATEGAQVQQIDSEIARLYSSLVLAQSRRPDCFVGDIFTELELLSQGLSTNVQFPVDGLSQPSAEAISEIRNSRRVLLRDRAPLIQSMTPGQDQALELAKLYGAISQVELNQAQKLPPRDPVREELGRMGECDVIKALSLTAPYTLQELQRQRASLIP